MTKPRLTPPEKHRILASGIFTLILVMGLGRFAYTPMLSYMKTEAGVGEALGGWLAGWNYLGYLSGVILVLFIKSPKVRDHLLVASLFTAAFSTALMGLAESPVIWSLSRLLAGLSTACGFIIASGMMLNWLSRHNQKQELGLMYSGLGLGITFGAVLVELSGLYLDWAGQWLFLGVIGLLLAIPALIWRPGYAPAIDETLNEAYDSGEIPAAIEQAEKQPSPQHAPQPGRGWFTLLQFAYLFSGCAFVVYATFIVIIIEAEPALKPLSVWVWALLGLVAAPSTFIFDLVTRKTGFLRALAIAFGLKAVALSLVALTSGLIPALLSAILFGLTFVSIVSLAMNLAGRRFPENPAKYMAILTISYGIAQVIGPILSGHFAEVTGSFTMPLLICTALLLAGIICLEVMKQMQTRMERHALKEAKQS